MADLDPKLVDAFDTVDVAAAMRIVGILVLRLGGKVEIEPEELDRLEGWALVSMDFGMQKVLKLEMVRKGEPGTA